MKVSYFLPLIMLLFITSCAKEFDDPMILEDDIVIIAPVFIETTLFIKILGFSADEDLDALCTINGVEYQPDINGFLYISSILMNEEGQLVKVKAEGFMPSISVVIPSIDDVTQLKIRILKSRPIVTFDALEGGSFLISDSEYNMPALSIVDANGDDYLGTVNIKNYTRESAETVSFVTAHSHNVLIDDDGKKYSLQTWGGQDIFIYDVNGNEVFIKEGIKIQARLGIKQIENTIPDKLDIMIFNELTDKWELDSEAKLEGDKHIAEISNFGHLRWSKNIEVRRAKVKFNSENGPLASVTAQVRASENNPISVSSSNDKGDAYINVPVSGSYRILTYSFCGSPVILVSVYEEAVGNENEVLILKDFENVKPVASIEGRILDCNGNAVPFGVFVREGNPNSYFIADANGLFSAQYYICEDNEWGGLVYDPSAQVFSDVLNYETIPGMTVNLGDVVACQ